MKIGQSHYDRAHGHLSAIAETRGQCAFPFIFVLKDFVWSD